jgi:hypothetical protein
VINIDGVTEREVVCYGCPYIVDLTIDGRPAHYRSRHGSARLCFEDGEQETVWDSYNEGGGEGFSDIYERHMVTMVPALRRKAVRVVTGKDDRAELVKDFLTYAREQDYRNAELMQEDSAYDGGNSRVLHEHEVDAILTAWLDSLD